jgi:hypothetical protein
VNWPPEPFWLFWQREMTLQRALTAETSVERLRTAEKQSLRWRRKIRMPRLNMYPVIGSEDR